MTLARLNELRALHGKNPLKAWKESKAKLAEAIAKLEPQRVAIADQSMPQEVIDAAEQFARDVRRKVSPKKAIKNLEASLPEPKTLHLADIAREFGIDPRVARAKMRRVPTELVPSVGKHEYGAEHKETIVELLKRDFRKR